MYFLYRKVMLTEMLTKVIFVEKFGRRKYPIASFFSRMFLKKCFWKTSCILYYQNDICR